MEITRATAIKIVETVNAGLTSGLGTPIPGQMCVEAAICYALELPHGDDPQCVISALRALKIRLNDFKWSSNLARADGLRRLALAQIGSLGVVDSKEFLNRVVKMTIRKIVPIALHVAAKLHKDPMHVVALKNAAVECETKGTKESAVKARQIANAANAAANAADAANAAANAANAADYAAANAADAANAANAVYGSKRDNIFSFFAENVVQILIDLKSPGCQWLDLAPVPAIAILDS